MWRPGSAMELASVGDDYQLLLWDTRSPGAPAAKVGAAHGEADLHCVDWSPLQPELLVTGDQRFCYATCPYSTGSTCNAEMSEQICSI